MNEDQRSAALMRRRRELLVSSREYYAALAQFPLAVSIAAADLQRLLEFDHSPEAVEYIARLIEERFSQTFGFDLRPTLERMDRDW